MNQNESPSQENENAIELEEKYVSIPLNLSTKLNGNRDENWTLNNDPIQSNPIQSNPIQSNPIQVKDIAELSRFEPSDGLLPKWESDFKVQNGCCDGSRRKLHLRNGLLIGGLLMGGCLYFKDHLLMTNDIQMMGKNNVQTNAMRSLHAKIFWRDVDNAKKSIYKTTGGAKFKIGKGNDGKPVYMFEELPSETDLNDLTRDLTTSKCGIPKITGSSRYIEGKPKWDYSYNGLALMHPL